MFRENTEISVFSLKRCQFDRIPPRVDFSLSFSPDADHKFLKRVGTKSEFILEAFKVLHILQKLLAPTMWNVEIIRSSVKGSICPAHANRMPSSISMSTCYIWACMLTLTQFMNVVNIRVIVLIFFKYSNKHEQNFTFYYFRTAIIPS